MRRELNELKKEIAATNAIVRRTNAVVAQLVGKVSDMAGDMAENMATKKDIALLNERMDGFSGLLLDSRHRWAVHADTLAQHDARLSKLEAPKS